MNKGLPPTESKLWDAPLQATGGSFLQSRAWGRFQQELGREVVWACGEGWQWLAAVRVSRGLRYLMCWYGPAAKTPAGMLTALRSLMTAGRELNMDFVRVEPQAHVTAAQLHKLGARHIAELDPEHTRIINLEPDEAALRSALASGHRNLINGTQRRGITIHHLRSAADIEQGTEQFLAMMKDTARHSHIAIYPDDYYRTYLKSLADHAQLYVASASGKPVASALFYDWGATRTYAHAGAFQEQNRQAKASVSLVWQAIVDAKAAGAQRFDLGGTAPVDDTKHPFAGITKFKAAFGGEPVEYAGTWDIPLKPGKYRAYAIYRRLRGRR